MNKIKKKRYPVNWDFISAYIRYERAKNKCEECGLSNGMIIRRHKNGTFTEITFEQLEALQKLADTRGTPMKRMLKENKLTQIILTVAHLDHNEKNNNYSNLKALCQRCHLMHDKINNKWRIKYYKQEEFPLLFTR